MTEHKERPRRRGYSLAEIKEKYLPNRDLESLQQEGIPLTRDAFLDILRRISRPLPMQTDPEKKETSA